MRDLLEEKFQEPDFSDCFIIEINQPADNKLYIFVDSDSGMTFEKCRKISRYLEQYLDEHQWLGEKYVLEVSSPGIDRPLMFLRQYSKNKGRKVEVKLKDGSKKEGTLTEIEGDYIILSEKVSAQEKGKKKKIVKETEIPFDQIDRTIVKISFN